MARNEGLYQAVVKFGEALLPFLLQSDTYPSRDGWPVWGRDVDGVFRRSPRRWLWPLKAEEGLASLPEYQAAAQALRSDSVIAPQLGRLVGTPMSAAGLDEARVLSALAYASITDPPGLGYSRDQLDATYAEIEGYLYSNHVEYVALLLLSGLQSETHAAIEFGRDTVLDRLTDDELAAALSVGAFQSVGELLPAQFPQPWCIRVRFQLPKVVGSAEDFQSDAAKQRVQRTQERAFASCERALACLRLFKPGRVIGLAYMVPSVGPFSLGGTAVSLLAPGYPFFRSYDLDDGKAEDLQAFASTLCGRKVRRNKALENAIHWFSVAGEARRPDDVLLDLMIAAECLFLPNVYDELSYRFSLNAALLLGNDSLSRRKVYDSMHLAYQLRSDIVHTGAARSERLADGDTRTLPEFCLSLEETLRRSLKLAVSRAASQPLGVVLFDWTSMALGEEMEPVDATE